MCTDPSASPKQLWRERSSHVSLYVAVFFSLALTKRRSCQRWIFSADEISKRDEENFKGIIVILSLARSLTALPFDGWWRLLLVFLFFFALLLGLYVCSFVVVDRNRWHSSLSPSLCLCCCEEEKSTYTHTHARILLARSLANWAESPPNREKSASFFLRSSVCDGVVHAY